MAGILILYGSTEGQTAKIAGEMAATLRGLGHTVTVVNAGAAPAGLDPGRYDAVILGASLHAGHYQQSVRELIARHRAALQAMPAAFFSVSLSEGARREETRQAVHRVAEAFLHEVGWQPQITAHFAGALKYREYGLIMRLIMRMISKHEGGDTDTSRDYEYTDWDAVARFARDFATML